MDIKSQIWAPLNPARREIRLFILAPDEDQKSVPKGRLIVRSLEEQLHYDAISHAWGRPSFPEVVVIDGIEWLVSTGIFEALQRLRHEAEERCFWLDAICIDQSDLRERGEQVKLMQAIFNRAVNVQVWLGRNPTSVKILIDDMNDHPAHQPFSGRKNALAIQKDFDRLLDLVNLDYWSRTWVIQEIALARDVQFVFGARTFSMDTLRALSDQFDSTPRIGDRTQRYHIRHTLSAVVTARDVLPVATMGTLEGRAVELTRILQRARMSQCHDPRDRIYGFLGIMTSMFFGDFIAPNYEWSVAETYTDFVTRLVSKTGSLAVLNQAESICNSTPGLPTFVPDWACRFQQHDAFSRLNTYKKYRASGEDSTARAQEAAADRRRASMLKCSGFIVSPVDRIGECSRSVFGKPETKILEGVIRGWRREYPGGDAAFVRLITADRLGSVTPLATCLRALQPSFTSSGARSNAAPIRDAVGNATSNRRFFLTAHGMPGLGPRDTRQGDVVAILAGGRVPYVLRRSPNAAREGLDLFSFVGDCYVEGAMQGELLDTRQPPFFADIWLE